MTHHTTLPPERLYLLAVALLLSLPLLYLLPMTSRKGFISYLILIVFWIFLITLVGMLR